MRRFLLFAAMLVAFISIQAQSPEEVAPAIAHLSEVNAEWTHQPELAPKEEVHFENDIQRIHYHLDWVVKNLRRQTPSDLDQARLKTRLSLIDTLEAYAANEVFPQNIYHLERRPYFIDHRGVHCAVGYLMKASGHGDLAQRISLEQNYAYVREIRTEGVAEWADNQGFSLDELAWIQPGYAPSTSISTIGTGTNGPVLTMAPDFYDGGFVFAGDFTVLDGSPCNGVGFYRNGNLTCLPGLNGNVRQITKESNAIIAVGEFFGGGQTYPIAIHDSAGWRYEAIPGREGAIGTACFGAGGDRFMEVTITPPQTPGMQELWHLTVDNGWQRQLTVKGQINDIEGSYEGRIYVGHFDSTWVSRPSASDSLMLAHNLVFGPNYEHGWRTAGPEISDTAQVVKVLGSTIYIGGTCSPDQQICLTRYLNGTLQPVVLHNDLGGIQPASIQALAFYYQRQESQMIFGGDFYITPFVVTYGQHLAQLNLGINRREAIASLNGPVTDVVIRGDDVFFGGYFGNDSTGHLAMITDASTSIGQIDRPMVSVSPNPIEASGQVTGVQENCPYLLMDMSGRTVATGKLAGQEIDLSSISSGMYVLTLSDPRTMHRLKVVKQ